MSGSFQTQSTSIDHLIGLLHRCRQRRDLPQALQLLRYAREHRLETHSVVGNHLVPLLVDCHRLPDAQLVFDKLEVRNQYSWSSLIAGYVECGDLHQALRLYCTMSQQESVRPYSYTFVALLKGCARLENLPIGRELCTQIALYGLDTDPSVGTAMVDMFAKCGVMAEALKAFSHLSAPSVVAWTALIAGYVEHGLHEDALHSFKQMQLQGVCPDVVTYICSFKACSNEGAIGRGELLFSEIVKHGLEADEYIGSTVVDMYAKSGALTEAHQVLDLLPFRTVVSWTALIAGYAEHGLGYEALNCYDLMQMDGVSPNVDTFISGLKACSCVGTPERGQQLHSEITNLGWDRDLYVGTALVEMLGRCSCLLEAQDVFNKVTTWNTVLWSTLIAGYVEQGCSREALSCFNQMQLESFSPIIVTFIWILKACGKVGSVAQGQVIHDEIIKKGSDRDLTVCNTLMSMYGKCSWFLEARDVFDKLPVRHMVSWNVLMTEYAEQGLGDEVLTCFKEMQLVGVRPNDVTFMCSLKACGIIRNVHVGVLLCAEMSKLGLESDVLLGTAMMSMYCKCGLLAEALAVFDKLSAQDTISWYTLIVGFSEHGLTKEAQNCFDQMQLGGILPDVVTIICILKTCRSICLLERGQEIHTEVIQRGWERELNLQNALMEMYSKCGSLLDACEVFDKLKVKDALSWGVLISSYTEHGLNEKVLECYEQMQQEGLTVDAITFSQCLKACSKAGALETGQKIHAEVRNMGLDTDCLVGNTLVDVYTKCGLILEGQEVFDKLPVRDIVSWNALLSGYTAGKLCQQVLSCIEQMQNEGISPDTVTYVCGLKACSTMRNGFTGQLLCSEIFQKGLEGNIDVGSTMLDMYCKCGLLAEGQKIFDQLPARNCVSWTVLIAGYAEKRGDNEALKCFEEMQLEGVAADAVTYVRCLKSCGTIGALEVGRKLHMLVKKLGFDSDPSMGTALVNMYGQCGLLAEGREVFESLSVRDIVCWNTMIKIYGKNHKGYMAVQCIEDMHMQGVKPNATTFICLLLACNYSSLVLQDQGYLEVIEHKLELSIEHSSCIVNLLARSGHLHEAERFADATECFVSKEVSKTLLIACKVYGEADLAHRYFKRLIEANEEDSLTYPIMPDIYTRIDSSPDTIEMTKLIGAEKRPAYASIDQKKLLEFLEGNKLTDISSISVSSRISSWNEEYVAKFNSFSKRKMYFLGEKKSGSPVTSAAYNL